MTTIEITDDPLNDFLRYQAMKDKALERIPKCDDCGETIQDEFLYDIDGEVLCKDCVNYRYRKYTDDYLKED